MLDVSAATDPASSRHVVGGVPHSPAPNFLRRALPGMAARGYGIGALCAYLGLARTMLLDLVVELDLPTPHDRPPRKPGGRNPWTFADTALFIVLWMAGWHAESLGERFGRTAGGVRAKARRLGLPRRDRELVFRPARPGEDLPGGVPQGFGPDPGRTEGDRTRPGDGGVVPAGEGDADSDGHARGVLADGASSAPGASSPPAPILARGVPATDAAIASPSLARAEVDLFGPTPVGMLPERKPKRLQAGWTRERDQELARRWWARQHYKAIARDMGLSPKAVQDRRMRLELPAVHELPPALHGLVDRFDPGVVEANIVTAGYIERRCNTFASEGKVFWFWTKKRNGSIKSKEVGRLEKRRTKRFRALPAPVRPASAPVHVR